MAEATTGGETLEEGTLRFLGKKSAKQETTRVEQFDSVQVLFDEFSAQAHGAIVDRYAGHEGSRRTLLSIVGAGVSAACSRARADTELRAYWTGSWEQVSGLVRVFSLAMLSRWSRKVFRPVEPAEELNAVRESWVEGILRLFGSDDASLEEFRRVDVQFNADCDYNDSITSTGQSLRFIEHDLLMILGGKVLGRVPEVPLAHLSTPVEDRRDLVGQGLNLVQMTLPTLIYLRMGMLDDELLMYAINEKLVPRS